MKLSIAAAIGLLCLSGVPAASASLCNCCGDKTEASCSTACAAVKPAKGQCIATVDFAAEADVGPNVNPLYNVPLRNMWLGTPSRNQLESFRRLLEKARKGAESDRKLALRAKASGKIDEATAQSRAARYDDAMVNYYLGIQAYRLSRDGT
jgi:hypothetical protein